MQHQRRFCLLMVVYLGSLGLNARGDEIFAVPRYKLHPGQVLTYRQRSEFRHKSGTMTESALAHFQVMRANPDGSWHLIFDATVRSGAASKSATTPQGILKDFASKAKAKFVPALEAETTFKLAEFDLWPDGRVVVANSVDLLRNDPTDYLATLPPTPAEQATGWAAPDFGPSRSLIHYGGARRTDHDLVFTASFERLWDRVYEASLRQTITFDTQRGLIRRIESADTMKFAWNAEGDALVELVGESTLPPDELTRLTNEAGIYFAARRRHSELLTATDREPSATLGRLDAAEATLLQIQGRMTLPIFTAAIADAIKQDKQVRSYYVEQAKKRFEVLGQPAADWELKDLAGQTHTLAGLRGRVVVLDFWYRGCGWCVRAMPQIKQLADDFRGQPVTILGMNNDKEVKNAEIVAEAAALNYPTLRAEGIPEKYNVQSFPTLIIIDPDGKVADIRVGYTPDLRAEVAAAIKRLLAEQAGGSPNPKAN